MIQRNGASSAADHGVVREAYFARMVFTSSAVTGDAVFPHELRSCVSTAAISASFIVSPHAYMTPLYFLPATSISPCRPCNTIAIGTSDFPVSHSEPASGGKLPSTPSPVAW